MIEREISNDGAKGRYVLRPHRSASWEDNLLLVACVAMLAVPIAVGWAVIGFWPILPLCGLELAFLLAGLYVVNRDLLAQEVITVQADQVVIEAGRRQVERRFDLGRHWAQVWLQPPRRRTQASRLIIRSHGRAVELGRFLTDAERSELAEDLRAVLARPTPVGPAQE